MRDIKIRYIFKHVGSRNFETKIYSLCQLEEKLTRDLSPCFALGYGYKMLARDQYTGLKDKNGREIYEGDVVKQEYSKVINVSYDESSYGVGDVEQLDGHHIGEVVTIPSKGVCLKNPLHYSEDEGSWSISNQYKDVAGYRSEVIGNTFENPELLEVKS